jgi:hypothetical protein
MSKQRYEISAEDDALVSQVSELLKARRAADQSLPVACATDSPARLRQSLPQSGSPPTSVCYDYSAQPSIAEAGLAPASMSKTEGCTQEFALCVPACTELCGGEGGLV